MKGYLKASASDRGMAFQFDLSDKRVVFWFDSGKLQYIIFVLPFGPTVGQKTVPMFGCFAKIEVEKIKKIRQ